MAISFLKKNKWTKIVVVNVTMLRQYLGLPSPQKRPALDSKEKNKLYDQSKRKRSIVPSWKTEFEWLICDNSHDVKKCLHMPSTDDEKKIQTSKI